MTTRSNMAKERRSPLPTGVEILGKITPAFSEILTPEALAFVAKLQRQFGTRRKQMSRAPAGAAETARSGRRARLLARDETDPRRRLEVCGDLDSSPSAETPISPCESASSMPPD